MSARQRRFWWVAAIVIGIGGAASMALYIATGTDVGRAWLRRTLLSQANAIFKGRGTLRVGAFRSLRPGAIVADDVALLDTAGVPVVSAHRVEAALSVRALWSKAIQLRRLTVDGLELDLRQDRAGRPWNIAYIISGDTTPSTPHAPGFGDDVRIDTVIVQGADIRTIAPWSPNAIFQGKARDSVIAVRDSLHDLVRLADGQYFERRRIALDRVRGHALVVVDPKHRPSSLHLDSLQGTLSDPPVRIRHAEGDVAWTGDSLHLALDRVQLPNSTGSAVGTVSWYQPGPVRFDVVVRADAGLADLGWVWDALPPDGRGRAVVRMRTLADANNADYALDSLDVTSGASRIRGRIAVTVRLADLLLHDADLTFTPLRSELLRRISYGAVPATVSGDFSGRVVARAGGPLRALPLDLLSMQFADDSVRTDPDARTASGTPVSGTSARGTSARAVSALTLRGLVSLGAQPGASGVTVDSVRIDLRSARRLVPTAPAVDGFVTGALLVRSANLSAADLQDVGLTWTDAVGNVSTVRGAVQARYAREPYAVTADLKLEPLSLRALARIDSTIPARSTLVGTVSVDGRLDSLQWRTALHTIRPPDSTSTGGTVALEGTASVSGHRWVARADGTLEAFDVSHWLERTDVPSTALSGRVRFGAHGPLDTLAARRAGVAVPRLEADGQVTLQQAASSERPAFTLVASAALDAERLRVDSATLQVGALLASARGALARDSVAGDTLEVSIRADSLSGLSADLTRLAANLAPMDSALAASIRRMASDTLQGDATVSGYLFGSLARLDATAALGARALQVGAVHIGRVVGSVRALDVLHQPTFEGAASADEVRGLGALRIQTASVGVTNARSDSGAMALDVSTEADAHLVVNGAYRTVGSQTIAVLDSILLTYDKAAWRAEQPVRVALDSGGVRLEPSTLRSNQGGVLAVQANVPARGAVTGSVQLERFPVGEVSALLAGTEPFDGTLSGAASLTGTRAAPEFVWRLTGDALGVAGYRLPSLLSTGQYADRRLTANATLQDTSGHALRVQAQVPMDLRLEAVEKRVLADVIQGEVVADSLHLDALPIVIDGVSRLRGTLTGRLGLSGTVDRPVADGVMRLDGVGALIAPLAIEPTDGQMVLRAQADSLVLESFRIRSGGVQDTLGARGVLRFAADQPLRIGVAVEANNFAMARQRDGTDLDLGGHLDVQGELRRPVVQGALYIPRANLFVNPLGERTALDLTTQAARALLGADEVPVAESAAQSLARLGSVITVQNTRVDLGPEVWVQTPEARVKLSGGLTVGMSGERLVLEGEILAERGQYRLDLGVVRRSFSVDSGQVRFFGQAGIAPTLDISATNVVRVSGGGEVPVRVHIGGTYEKPVLTLSSTDPLYASAPESEIISLLVFGAPTFALDGQSQSTVRAVTGVLLPTVGGLAEGALQKWIPGLSTLQVKTGSGQDQSQLTAGSFLDNLSVVAGKQIGDKTFLRLNTGICRGTTDATTRGTSPWFGVAAEYRLARTVSAQVGMDPGSAPCSRVGGDTFRMQFGFDLFKEWIW